MASNQVGSSGRKRPIKHETDEDASEEIKRLKAELMLKDEQLKSLKTSKKNTPERTVPGFFNKEDKLVEGFEHFISRSTNAKKIYASYKDWYTDILPIMQRRLLYKYKEHLFFKVVFEKKPKKVTFESGTVAGDHYLENMYAKEASDNGNVFAELYGEGWNEQSMKLVVILHPSDLSKVNEMDCSSSYFDDIDHTNTNDWSSLSVTNDYYSDDKELIICCKRKPKEKK